MDMDYQRFPGQFLRGDAGVVSQPVMGVDDIEFILVLHGYGPSDHGVAGHLLHQVFAILAGELVFLAIGDAEILDLALPLLIHYLGKLFRICVGNEVGADMDELDFL